MAIKAYHYVPDEAIRSIMDRGEIVPASERVDPSIFMWDCQSTRNEIRHEIESDGLEPGGNAEAALYDWTEEEVESLEAWQRQLGVEETHRETQFFCVDLLAGDLDRIFLSIGSWVRWAPSHTGFAFDAEELIRKGGGLRSTDLGLAYSEAIKSVLVTGMSYKKARRALKNAVNEVTRSNTLWKKDAKEWLRQSERSAEKQALLRDGRVELVWEGSLPLKMAIEVWRKGRRVAV